MNTEETAEVTRIQNDARAFNAANSLQIRLNTDPIVKRFELDLRGLVEVVKINEDGEEYIDYDSAGNSLANEIGIQLIMGHVNVLINHQVVQGRLDQKNGQDEYGEFLCRTRKAIAKDLMTNLNELGIRENNFSGIMAKIMRLAELFVSRTIDGNESTNMSETIRTVENTNSQVRGTGGMKIPFINN